MLFKKDPNNPLMSDHTEPALLRIDGIRNIYCYYRTDSSIGVMESLDGLNWKDYGMILTPSKYGFDSEQVIAPSALYDDGTIYLYYEGVHKGGSKIGVATSNSPLGPFIKEIGPRLEPEFWETTIVGTPLITKSPKGKYCLFYHGAILGFMDRIAVAYGSTPLGPWVKETRNPIIESKSIFKWDSIKSAPTSGIWLTDYDFLLFYEGFRGWPWTVHGFNIGSALVLFTVDGRVWQVEKNENNPILKRGSKKEWDSLTVQRPGVILSPDGKEIWMYYSGANKDGFQLGRAISSYDTF
jgi:hypothetical protein